MIHVRVESGKALSDDDMEITFRLEPKFGGDRWSGICLDFNIAVGDASAEAAAERLRCAVEMYLDFVYNSHPEVEREQFLTRRAPQWGESSPGGFTPKRRRSDEPK